jgi:hypothetical protein
VNTAGFTITSANCKLTDTVTAVELTDPSTGATAALPGWIKLVEPTTANDDLHFVINKCDSSFNDPSDDSDNECEGGSQVPPYHSVKTIQIISTLNDYEMTNNNNQNDRITF